MTQNDNDKVKGIPENAYTELKPGEEYHPVMPPTKTVPEVSFWSVSWGLLMAIIFSAAAAYLGLKIGQVFEAAIPIAIIAVGLSLRALFTLSSLLRVETICAMIPPTSSGVFN